MKAAEEEPKEEEKDDKNKNKKKDKSKDHFEAQKASYGALELKFAFQGLF